MPVFIITSLVLLVVAGAFAYLARSGYQEIQLKKRILAIGIRTTAQITGRISASQRKKVISPAGGAKNTAPLEIHTEKEFPTNALARIEFDLQDGRRVRQRSKKPPRDPAATHLEVIYDPENPSDCMIDGYYRIAPFYPVAFILIGSLGVLGALLTWVHIAFYSEVAVF